MRSWVPGDPSQLALSVSRAALSAWSPLCQTSRLFPQSASLAGFTVREPRAHLTFTQWTSIHQTPVLGRLDPEATGLTLGRHRHCLSWIRSCQRDEFSNLQMPENGARTQQAPFRTGSEGCFPLWSVFFISFWPPSKSPIVSVNLALYLLDQGYPGLTSITLGSPGPGSQTQIPEPWLPSTKKLPIGPLGHHRGWGGSWAVPGSLHITRTSPFRSPSLSLTSSLSLTKGPSSPNSRRSR